MSSAIDHWGSTPAERRRRYPCDDVLPEHEQALFRAVAVDAPPPVVFRWLCQLKVAPYSYDLLDNGGRRSPQHLVPGVDRLVVGERVLIFELASFAADDHLTLCVRGHRAFGDVAISYVVLPDGPGRSRLVVKLVTVRARGLAGTLLGPLLPAGDLVMMRRQLLNLKALAEATAGAPVAGR
ncbi:MAG TPA: hypothetical protein VFI47_19555 [Acidimicrobiales bacterium]|nr:hypothetical protein [Acidimicrobiales bacterium]